MHRGVWLCPRGIRGTARTFGDSTRPLRNAVSALALALGMAAACAQPVDRFANAGTSEAAVGRFLAVFQKAVAQDDRSAVTRLFACPCVVWDGRRRLKLNKASQLLPRYDAVFDADLKTAIAAARTEDLFSNGQGVMLGDGRVWFSAVGQEAKLAVITINAPIKETPAGQPR